PSPGRSLAATASEGARPCRAPAGGCGLGWRAGARSRPRAVCSGGGSCMSLWLLPRHGDLEALLRGDEVVGVRGVVAEVDLDPVHLAGELVAARPVVLRHHGAALDGDVDLK